MSYFIIGRYISNAATDVKSNSMYDSFTVQTYGLLVESEHFHYSGVGLVKSLDLVNNNKKNNHNTVSSQHVPG